MSVTFDAYLPATQAFAPEDADVSFNLSNSNAVFLCESLGIALADDGWCGSMPAVDFQGRVLMALAVAPSDEGVSAHELAQGEHPFGAARVIDCGRRPGYLQEKLAWAHDLAEWAVEHGAEVTWG